MPDRALQPAAAVALAYRYPSPTAHADLTAVVAASLDGATRRKMDRFLAEVGALDLGRWEELCKLPECVDDGFDGPIDVEVVFLEVVDECDGWPVVMK